MSEQSGYTFQNIVLLKSNFFREAQIDLENLSTPSLDISNNYHEEGEHVYCTIDLTFKVKSGDKEVFFMECQFVGVFQKFGNPKLEVETFGSVNAPSIIFPFIREHIASISTKAGLNPILLNPVNFAALAEKNKQR